MSETNKTTDDQISCDICMKEVPTSDAKSIELNDYVVHFCGLSCYEKWQQKNDTED